VRVSRLSLVAPLVLAALVSACSSGADGPSGTASEIAEKVFVEAGVEPFGPTVSITTDQEIEFFLGSTNYPEFTDTAVAQPMISIDPRILYVLQVATKDQAAETVTQLEADIDPQRLVCVQFSPDDVVISSRGSVVFLVIDSDHAERDALAAAFEAVD